MITNVMGSRSKSFAKLERRRVAVRAVRVGVQRMGQKMSNASAHVGGSWIKAWRRGFIDLDLLLEVKERWKKQTQTQGRSTDGKEEARICRGKERDTRCRPCGQGFGDHMKTLGLLKGFKGRKGCARYARQSHSP